VTGLAEHDDPRVGDGINEWIEVAIIAQRPAVGFEDRRIVASHA
jgi:hypothetical protein